MAECRRREQRGKKGAERREGGARRLRHNRTIRDEPPRPASRGGGAARSRGACAALGLFDDWLCCSLVGVVINGVPPTVLVLGYVPRHILSNLRYYVAILIWRWFPSISKPEAGRHIGM